MVHFNESKTFFMIDKPRPIESSMVVYRLNFSKTFSLSILLETPLFSITIPFSLSRIFK